MASLPVLSGQEAVRIFETFGWTVASEKQPHHYDQARRDRNAFHSH